MKFLEDVLQRKLFTISGTPIDVATVAVFMLVILATFLISAVIQRALHRFFRARGVDDEGSLGVTSRLVHYAVVAIGLGVGVHMLGIDLTALFAAGAVFAVAIGFAMQNISQNFISGVILLVERAIKPGDILDVEGQRVRVVDMGIRATVARTLDEEDIIIPNSILVQSMVKNHTLRDTLYRLRAPVGVVYSADMELVKNTLLETARKQTWRNSSKDPVVLWKGFGDSSVDFEVSVWVDDPWIMQGGRSKLNDAIWWALKDAGVTIAFPQLDVHLDPPVEKSLEGLRAAR